MTTAAHIIGALLRFLFGVVRLVVTLAMREQLAAFVVLVILVVLVLFWRVALSKHGHGWRRVRSIRFRLWLRLRPGRGFASLPELWLRWGRLAALSYGARSRPGLGLTARLTTRTTEFAVRLGQAQYGRRLYAAFELHLLVLAPPRTDKTGMLADRIIRHPGPVLTTSTRADLHQLTSPLRRGLGPVYVFNPEGVGDVPSTFAWDLLGVCTDELTAFKMADWFVGDTPGYGDLSWFEEQGTMGMSGLLLAAARTGATLADVYQWTQRRGHERVLATLADYGNPQLHAAVRALMEENRTAASVRTTIARALKWAVIPQLAAAADRRGRFSAREFALYGGTLHLIASGDARSVITPLLRALASYVHYEAGLAGSRTRAGQLDPPLLMAMDEVAQVCPVDLPSMLADSAGKGIIFVTVGHSLAKLKERYGEEGAASIWAISGVKMLLRGITEPETLEDVSRVCGTLGEEDDDKVRIVPPDVLRRLPKHCALVINMDLAPVIVRVSRAWKRRSVRRLARQVPALRAPWEVPAEEMADWTGPEPGTVPVSANGHGGKPGPLVGAGPE
jgi:type IV secretory pathway TraG/TraD family ATPase VirD4